MYVPFSNIFHFFPFGYRIRIHVGAIFFNNLTGGLNSFFQFHFLFFSERVYCTETRPYNQGARLTAYELVHEKIPSTLIVDSMVAALMRSRKISAVVVGADRVGSFGYLVVGIFYLSISLVTFMLEQNRTKLFC